MIRPSPATLLAMVCCAGAALSAPRADAQTAPAKPAADATGTWTIQDENASISTANLTDRYYTNGLRLGWTSGDNGEPDFLTGVGRSVWGNDGVLRFSFDLTQQIYTPRDTASSRPPSDDSPYAGVLLGNFGLWQDTGDARGLLGLSVGMVGPAALGRQVQNGFHDLIGQDEAHGWHYQLHNEPVFQLTSARTWRLPTGSVAGLDTDVLPELAVGLGSLRVYAETGLRVRLGQGLDSDYGPARLSPGIPSNGDTFHPTRPFAWYVFAGADGQGVAHDLTVEGNTWRDSPGAKLKPLMAEFEAGIGIMAYGARLTYTQVVQTQQAQHQKGGLHQLGSLALSIRF